MSWFKLFYSRFAHYTKYTEKRVGATKKNTILIGRGHQKSTFAGGQNNNVVITNFIQENKTCMYIETMQCSIKPINCYTINRKREKVCELRERESILVIWLYMYMCSRNTETSKTACIILIVCTRIFHK